MVPGVVAGLNMNSLGAKNTGGSARLGTVCSCHGFKSWSQEEARRQGQIRTLTSGFALAELVQVQQVLGVQPKLQRSKNAGQILLVYAGLILKVYHRKVSV